MNAHSRFRRIAALLTLVMLVASGLRLPAATPRALAMPAHDTMAAPALTTSNALAAAAAATRWVFQGPAPELNAQQDTVGVPQALESVSGAVAAIAPSPTNPDLVYLGTVNGGVWKSTNATAATPTWTPLTDQLKGLSIGIGAVALDPTDAMGQTLVAGTGRFSGYANRGDDLVGLYYTTDGGTTWTVTTSPLLSAANITGVAARGNTLLVASENGLYRTTACPLGAWTQISGTGGLPSGRASSIVADPANPNRLYVTFTGATGGIFRTDDLGATWANVSSGINVISGDTTAFNAAVYNDGTTNVVTVVLNGAVNGAAGIAMFRSKNGAPFTALDVPSQFTHAYGNFTIAADKTNSDLVYVAGGYIIVANGPFLAAANRVDASKPSGAQLTLLFGGVSTTLSAAVTSAATTLSVASTSGMPTTLPFVVTVDSEQMSVTAVSGTTLTVSRGANGTTATAHSLSATVIGYPTYGAPHVDINYLAGDASGGLLMGTHGSLYRLPDPASLPSDTNYWVSKNGNLGATEMHDVTYDSISKVLLGSNQDNIVVYQSAPASQTWAAGPSFSGDGGDVTVDTTTLASVPSTTLAAAVSTTTGTTLSVASTAGYPPVVQFVISVDGEQMLVTGILGTTLTVTRGALGTTKATHSAGATVTTPPQSIRYASNQTLSGFRRQVYTAANVLASNVAISYANITDWQFTTPIALNAADPTRLLLGGSANLYESLDMGKTIANIATVGTNWGPGPLVYGGYRNGQANPDVLYAGKGSTVYSRTAAGGAVTAAAALPAGAGTIRRIVMNPADWMNVFAIDSDQVFVTTDGGASWSDITGSLVSSGLSSAEFNGFAFVSGPSPYIAVGTRSGVFASLIANLGVWVKLGADLPDVLVFELAYDATDDVLVAGTMGRAAWKLPTASAAFTPVNAAPVLALSGPTTGNEGTTQYLYSFTVDDPGDRFTVNGPTITGGSLVAGSLTTTGSGGSFKVTFPDGPATASISLQVTDSTGLASNIATTSVTVANVAPVAAILGAPTSGSPGTTINLTSSVADPSAADQAVGFTYSWLVQKTVGTSVINFATGSAATFSYTPDVAAKYTVFFRAKDKDGLFSSYASKIITAASPDLTEDAASVTVGEGMGAVNSGTFANVNGNSLTLSASAGMLTRSTQILFADNFDSEPFAAPTSTLSKWTVTRNNVDVIGTGFVDIYPGNGHYLDMDGSASATLQSKTVLHLAPGTYQLSFMIGNNAFGSLGNNGLHFTVGSALDNSVPATSSLTSVVRQFTATSSVSAPIIFSETGPSDGGGSILDNVELVWLDSPSGAWSWSYNTDDGPAQSQDVTITATDNVNGEVTSLPFPLVVENVAPTATFANNGPVSEGSAGTIAFAGQSDLSAADTAAGFHYAYDFNNDGVFDSGDGSYAASSANASATALASYLAEGPGAQTVRGRIIDKDGGYTDYTTTITIDSAAPTASVDGPANLLVGQVGTFLFKATDPSASDQAAGFTYSVSWGDGSTETIAPVAGNGDATARHAYATTGSKTIQVTATDKNGATGAPVSATITVSAMTSPNLQAAIATRPVVYLQPADDAAMHGEVTAINGLSGPASPAQITIVLGAGPYTGVTLSPPDNIVLDLAGNHTADNPGTQITGASPAVTVTSGEVFVQGEGLSTATDSPTVLVTGGHLTLGQSEIQESTGANNVAVKVTGGSANLGFDVVMNVNGEGGFVSSYVRSALVPHPEGIDAELNPNVFEKDGVAVHASYMSSTSLTSLANPSVSGQAVTFTATISVNSEEHGPASGTVSFYDGATALGSGTVSKVGGAFVATYTTSALSVGTHTINAVYSGDQGFIASNAILTQVVTAPINRAPVAQSQAVTTNQDTAIAITLAATDADADPLTYSIVAQPAHGTLTGTAPNVSYTPAAGYVGSDSFTFKANDGHLDSNVATVSVTVVHVNHAPVAVNDSYTTLANTALSIAAPGVLSNDTDADANPLTAIKVTNPAHGTLTLNANGSFTYTPAANYAGADSFTYKATDGTAASNVATVNIAVKYSFTGFFGTVLNSPTLNQVNAGQNIAFTFGLGGNVGLNIFATGYPVSQPINCSTGALMGTLLQVTPAANLSYNATTGRYTYTAKTDKKWGGTCRQFNLRTVDGTDHMARFKFK